MCPASKACALPLKKAGTARARWEEAPAHLRVLHEFGEAELPVVLHVQEEQVVGGLLRRGVQEGHQQCDHLARAGHIRPRRHRLVHAACGAMGSDLFVHLRGRLDMLRSDNRAVQSIHVNYKCGQTFILQCLGAPTLQWIGSTVG